MAVGGITTTESRETAVDFTTPYYEESTGVIILLKAKRWRFFCQVYRPSVWLCIGCMPFLVTVASYLSGTVHRRCMLAGRSMSPATLMYTYFGNLLGQGGANHLLTLPWTSKCVFFHFAFSFISCSCLFLFDVLFVDVSMYFIFMKIVECKSK